MPKKKTRKKTVKKQRPADAAQDLLIELGTEELPPKSLKRLSQAFGRQLYKHLETARLTADGSTYQVYATPRRLAVRVIAVKKHQSDQLQERRGPALESAYDDKGQPTKALKGFSRSCGVEPSKLVKIKTGKGEWLVFRKKEKGKSIQALVPGILAQTIAELPIAKRMRWSDLDVEFVRPVHWLLVLYGATTIKCELLSVKSGQYTYGHRFHAPKAMRITRPEEYEKKLLTKGYVIADFSKRRDRIEKELNRAAAKNGGKALIDPDLLDEVTSLVEWPVVITGEFEKRFLSIPSEALTTTMQDNQKYFPIVSANGKLKPFFMTVCNIKSRSQAKVKQGNERVIRARFSDAEFFWNTDRQKPLESHATRLKEIVFHKKLGSLSEKTERIAHLSRVVAKRIAGDEDLAVRAARLAKLDLLTGMVGEFPELQGTMGKYYAIHDNKHEEVAQAIEEHYQPRFAGDRIPATGTGRIVAIADKLDTIIGIFSVGELPSGDKDPFGLRRAALGVLRILIEAELNLDLVTVIRSAAAQFKHEFDLDKVSGQVYEFMLDRLKHYYLDSGYPSDVFEAVRHCRPVSPMDFHRRMVAVKAFANMKEAKSLAAANKRIRNILRQSGKVDWNHVSLELIELDEERALARRVEELKRELQPLFREWRYTDAMKRLAGIRTQVDDFFDKVMVNVDEEAVRNNRYSLLASVSDLFLQVADISRLQQDKQK